MSGNWSQGGQPAAQRSANPPPVCFNCGIAGHFVVDCPESKPRPTPAAFAPAVANYQQYSPAQSWPAQAGPAQNQYQTYPPTPQYGPQASAPQYNYNQTQPYHAPPVNPPYAAPPYQPPPNQYAPPVANPQYGTQGYPASQQPYGTPASASYQSPQNNYPPNSGYGGYQGQSRSFSAQAPPHQWNDSQNGPRPNYPRQQRSNSGYQREYSNTPSQQSHRQLSQQYQQSPYTSGSEGAQQMQQMPAQNYSISQNSSTQGQRVSSIQLEYKGTTSYKPEGIISEAGDSKHDGLNSINPNDGPEEQEEKPEEGEVGPEDEEEEAFLWDLEHAFEVFKPKETVALAQPLSASFKSTPVPLIQAWSIKVPSISRYAMKDNLSEYMRTIRLAPQWSYLQEDPAFADGDLEGDLIPFDQVPAWMALRHGMILPEEKGGDWQNSRKHPRDENEDESQHGKDSFNEQITKDDVEEHNDHGPRIKRSKHEDPEKSLDDSMEDAKSVGTPGTLVVIAGARGGTPCLANIDDADVWAPEPGERATSPPDPTEALLASLGVSGDAKPIKPVEPQPYVGAEEDESSPQDGQSSQTPGGSQPSTSFPPAPTSQNQPPPISQGFQMISDSSSHDQPLSGGSLMHNAPMGSSPINSHPRNGPPTTAPQVNNGYGVQNKPQGQYGPPVNTPYATGPGMQQQFQNGPPVNGTYSTNIPYGPQAGGSYSNGPPTNPQYPQPDYGPPANAPYTNGPPNNYPSTGPQYGAARNSSYGNAPGFNGPQGPQAYNHYAPPAPYAGAPPQNGSFVQPQYGPPTNQPYANSSAAIYHQGPHYGPPRNASYVNTQQVPGSYGSNNQMSPTQYGPPQNQHYSQNPYPNQHYPNGPAPQYANTPQGHLSYQNGAPPQSSPETLLDGNGPSRHDSGYASTRGSYSTAAGPSQFDLQTIGIPQSEQAPSDHIQGGDGNQNSPGGYAQGHEGSNNPNGMGAFVKTESQLQQDMQSTPQHSIDGDSTIESAEKESEGKKRRKKKDMLLTDLEKELIGELEAPLTARRNPLRKTATKKPQPVVEAAYGRRW